MARYFALHKPYGVLSQFSDEDVHPGLGSIIALPKGVYSVGRLDLHSEGLLLLTSDKTVNAALLTPKRKHVRVYLVQVAGQITKQALRQMEQGIEIQLKSGTYTTLPAKARKTGPPNLPERNPPIKEKITSWIRMELTEGKNRQVRKMTAATGFPTLRLIRVQIENLQLGGLKPGEIQEFSKADFYGKLNLGL